MKILGIGNAIVDVICKVSDSFITKNNLTKGFKSKKINFLLPLNIFLAAP